MSERIHYYRVSTHDQTVESQRHALGGAFDAEYADVGVSGAVPAMDRPAFRELFAYIRRGDVLHVYAIDRLGRDAIDVQSTVRALLAKGVALEVHGLGRIAAGVGELILAVLAQIADMERQRIVERTSQGRERARELIATTGKTQNGKTSLGRPEAANPAMVREWRANNKASIAATAKHFTVSTATVKRYCAGQ
ncbi:recombinase family protein [Acidovorax sp. Root568]|uniref:recombinase family protein n=1 Tax=Acidovorax sp. Root568 TaxID=1736565 RepID=UPI0009E75476|nr:recombinase family protein [Acidovorax sp. Root568]